MYDYTHPTYIFSFVFFTLLVCIFAILMRWYLNLIVRRIGRPFIKPKFDENNIPNLPELKKGDIKKIERVVSCCPKCGLKYFYGEKITTLAKKQVKP